MVSILILCIILCVFLAGQCHATVYKPRPLGATTITAEERFDDS